MRRLILALTLLFPIHQYAQYCESFELTLEDELLLGCTKNTLTALHDQLNRNYLYAANSEGGMSVISLSDPTNMELELTLPGTSFDDLNVNSITQEGQYLYLALGNLFGAHSEPSGLAIVDVTDPLSPIVKDVWSFEETGGAAHVAVQGHYAYLSGLSNGIIVLNIADKTSITFVSQFVPDNDWPLDTGTDKINARNLVLEENIGYLAYDAGGIRIIDISNPLALSEIGRYSNPALDGMPRAYNNSVKIDDLLYVAVDYAGVEILNVANPAAITLVGWWNPNNLPLATTFATAERWFSSPWHANELEVVEECGTLFFSGGRTEITGLDISDPSAPTICGSFGDSTDNQSAWGMSMYNDNIYAGLICSPLPIPFPAAWSGVKSLTYNSDCPLSIVENEKTLIAIYPNPATSHFTIDLSNYQNKAIEHVLIYDLSGQLILSDFTGNTQFSTTSIQAGLYLVKVQIDGNEIEQKLIIR